MSVRLFFCGLIERGLCFERVKEKGHGSLLKPRSLCACADSVKVGGSLHATKGAAVIDCIHPRSLELGL